MYYLIKNQLYDPVLTKYDWNSAPPVGGREALMRLIKTGKKIKKNWIETIRVLTTITICPNKTPRIQKQ
jgi:hypothetical protein